MAALSAGCHVLVEKPMTTEPGEAEEIYRLVQKTGLKLQVDFNHRWLSPYHKVKEMIVGGPSGRADHRLRPEEQPALVPTEMLASWSASQTTPGVVSSPRHDIDLMTWWFDVDPVEVYARGIKRVLNEKGFDTYDGIQSLVTYAGGPFATYEAAWIYPNTSPYMPDSYMELIGTKGTTQIDRQAEAIDAILQQKFTCPRTFLNYKVFDQWVGAMPGRRSRSFVNAIKNETEPHVDRPGRGSQHGRARRHPPVAGFGQAGEDQADDLASRNPEARPPRAIIRSRIWIMSMTPRGSWSVSEPVKIPPGRLRAHESAFSKHSKARGDSACSTASRPNTRKS